MTFEEKISYLEDIIKNMSSGKYTLEESIEKYSESLKILKECKDELDSFKLKVEVLEDTYGNN